ncbi:unnamed protein product [Caenorhabditis auriculariae]|uniref:Apoptosis-inducing factor 1, mitochondrial n=1 Tax=Caenorhabditis auriculariae TaxID=2777116 RepID=A0A8S1H0I1_9PELO|nr:unnamed protein product [Caenorhabditis auriculariae]
MLLRAFCRNVRIAKSTQFLLATRRPLSTTSAALGGGGHHHHEPTPVYIPKPGSLDWSLCGRPGVKRISTDSYNPKKDDFLSYLGAAVAVGLTIAALAVYTDTFKGDKDNHSKNPTPPKQKTKEIAEKSDKNPSPESGKAAPPKKEEAQEERQEHKPKVHDEDKPSEKKNNGESKKESDKKNSTEGSEHAVTKDSDKKSENMKSEKKEEKPKVESSEKSKPEDKPEEKSEEKPKTENKDKKTDDDKKDENKKEDKKSSEDKPKEKSDASGSEKKSEKKEEKKEKEQAQDISPAGNKKSDSKDKKQNEVKEDSKASSSNERKLDKVQYLIVGSGTAAYYAALAIRAKHADAKVLMIGEEKQLPYNKPPLSKELWWYGDSETPHTLEYTALSGKKRDIFYEVQGFYVDEKELEETLHGGVSLISGKKVVKVCTADKKAYLEDGSSVSYDKLLVATGSRPQPFPLFDEADEKVRRRTSYYHNVDDYKKLENEINNNGVRNITVIGSGLLASELVYGIKRKYEDVVVNQVLEEPYNASLILPQNLGEKASNSLEKMGVVLYKNDKVTKVEPSDRQINLKLASCELNTDYVVVALGTEPNIEVAEASGLSTDPKFGGVTADSELKVAEDVWAAGDAVCFDDKVLGRRRIEHWEHAQISGRLAGENMVGAQKAFWYQPSFFSKFAPNFHMNAVGRIDSSLPTVTVYAERNLTDNLEKAVVFYKGDKGQVVGVLLLNVFGMSLDVARRIIDDAKPISDYRDLTKLFPLYEIPTQEENDNETSKETA